MKCLYVNGCSMTKYGRLVEDLQWPNLLRKALDIPQLVNDGMGCGSNQRIFRTTHDFVNSKGFDADQTLMIIQMTYPFRFEFRETNGRWATVNQNNFIAQDGEYAESYRQAKLKYFSDEEEKYEYLQKLFAIDNLLKMHRVRNYFFVNYRLPVQEKHVIKFLDRKISWVKERSAENSHFPIYECFSDSDLHPSANGYVTIADWILGNIKSRIKYDGNRFTRSDNA